MRYAGDYSANYQCLSIPNAGWVTGQTGGGVAQGTTTTMEMEAGDTTDFRPENRVFYLALSGVNTIVFNHWAEIAGNSTTTSDATIELIRVA
jgi:hypothetical protein